jgi:C_GCAxxG_C_C family probable redox protein
MTDPIRIAQDRFTQGYNCSQAVLSAFAGEGGISEETALKLASPFGGGIARQGGVCGALTGALMALGLHQGNATPEGKENTYQISEEFIRRFKERHGTILCRELIGYDLSIPEELQKAREGRVFSTICPALVSETARLLAEMLKG